MILQNSPVLSGNERKYVLDCIDTNWISSAGSYVTRFEEAFASYCGAKFGVTCSNGSTAIHLLLEAMGIGPGDEVIVPSFTLIADSNMVILAGAKPVFADVDAETWCLDPRSVEQNLTPQTKAILAVHMYGHPCDMDALRQISDKHGLYLIEDAAEAHGTLYKGRRAGSLGDAACFSFYGSKTLTTGEGGMVVTDNEPLASRLRLLRSHAFDPSIGDYTHEHLGFNYRLTNIQAAIGLAQTEEADRKIEAKRRNSELYRQQLESCAGVRFQSEKPWATSSYWNTAVMIDPEFGVSRSDVISRLAAKGIQTRASFRALHTQPVYAKMKLTSYPNVNKHMPVSVALGDRGVCLPSGVGLTEEQIQFVSQALIDIQLHRGV